MSAPVLNCAIVVDHPVTIAGSEGAFDAVREPGDPMYVTNNGVGVWMERKRQRTRFLDADAKQVGPVHANFVPAILWAANEGWRDPGAPDWFNDAVIAEVRAGGAKPQKGQPGYVEPGAWTP